MSSEQATRMLALLERIAAAVERGLEVQSGSAMALAQIAVDIAEPKLQRQHLEMQQKASLAQCERDQECARLRGEIERGQAVRSKLWVGGAGIPRIREGVL